MVYMMNTPRAGRPTKEKTPKTNTHSSKSDGAQSQKFQPTTEQMRMAQMSKTTNKSTEDPEIEAKIEQLTELTGRTKEQAFFVLHDCDYDLNRAVEKLLENEDKGEWQEMKTKKKKSLKSESEPVIADEINDSTENSNHNHKERDHGNDRQFERSGSAPRNRRNDKAPPRFQKAGRGRNQNSEDNERFDRGDSQSRDRGRGRGRGSSRGRGRGRGGGGGGGSSFRRGEGNRERGSSNFDDGPGLPIDTWTNEVAEEKKDNSFGNWGDMAEDWTTDEWQGNLKETTVFTSSEASKMFNDNDAKMFSVTSIETQAFNNSLSNSMPSPPRLPENYQHSGSSLQQSSMGPDSLQTLTPKPIGQGSIAQQPPIGQNSAIGQGSVGSSSMGQNSLGQRLDLGILLSRKPAEYKPVDSAEAISQQTAELTKETADFMAQFQKNLAAESIKNAVGIGSSSSQSANAMGGLNQQQQPQTAPPAGSSSHGQQTSVAQQSQTAAATQSQPSQQQQSSSSGTSPVQGQQQQSHPKQQRSMRSSTKLPPPSKIPASAVVMPGSGSGSNFGGSLDVEFGCFSESPGFSFGSVQTVPSAGVNNAYTGSSASSSLNNHLNNKTEQQPTASSVMTSAVATSQQQSAAMSVMLESMTQQQNSQSPRPTVFQSNSTAQSTKDYTQSAKISSPPEPIPFPTSQTDRKSPYQSSISDQTSAGNSYSQQNTYNSNVYHQSSTYKSSAQPPSAISTAPPSGAGSGVNSYSGAAGNLTASLGAAQSSGLQNYQSSSFQSQQQTQSSVGSSGGYTGNNHSQANSNSSLYQNSTNHHPQAASSFQSQGPSYGNGKQSGSGGGVYQTQSAYQHHTRDSQSAPAFQSSTSQSGGGSSYQGGVSVTQSSGSSYQRESSQAVTQSGYASQLNYGSSVSVSGQSVLSSSKLSESLGKLTVKDNAGSVSSGNVASNGNSGSLVGAMDKSSMSGAVYDNSSQSAGSGGNGGVMGASLSTNTNTTASSVAAGTVAVSAPGGISSNSMQQTGSVSSTHSSSGMLPLSSKSSAPASTKAPVSLPPGIPPLIGHGQANYMIGQPGFPIAAFGLQQPMYSYEDLVHQRLPMHTATTMTSLEQNKLAAAAAAASYSAADASKMNRLDAQSPVNAQTSQPSSQTTQQQPQAQSQQTQQNQQTQQQSAAHGQAFIPNPTAGLPGYYNYYVGGLPQGYSYPTPFLPVNNIMPPVTNPGVTTTNTQFQKAGYGYSGTGYDSLSAMSGQTHDFNKAYSGGASQTQNKASVNAASLVSVSSNSDLTAPAATSYPKAHQQAAAAFDKTGFATGTPPPYNLPPGLPAGTQAGALSGTPFMTQYAMPPGALAHPGQMLHQLHQDTSGGSSRAAQQSSSQPKSLVGTKGASYSGYWGN